MNPMLTDALAPESAGSANVSSRLEGSEAHVYEENNTSITSELSIGSHRFTGRPSPSECFVIYTEDKEGSISR